jgi:hypothetical protein
MALPQRRDPNEERRIQEQERRRIETDPGVTGGGFGWWWLWLLIIIAIIWFAGWGWGGYGGWWWGRRAPATGVYAPVNGSGANGTATNANGNGANGAAAAIPTGEGVAILNATNKSQFIGQKVDIRDVRVNNKINDHALWIGNNNSNGNGNAGNGNGNAGNAGAAGNNQTANGSTGTTENRSAAMVEVPTLVLLSGATGHNDNSGNHNANQTPGNTVNGNLKNVNSGELVNVTGTVEKAPSEAVAKKEFGLDNDAAKRLERDGAYIRASQIMTAAPAQQQ